MQEQGHDRSRMPAASVGGARALGTPPRLELPRFRFAPTTLAAPPAAAAPAGAAARLHQQPVVQHPPVSPRPTWQATTTALPAPVAVSWTPAPPSPAAAPRFAAAPPPVVPSTTTTPGPGYGTVAAPARSTRPATISWDRLAPPPAEPTLLQRITPVHMGVLLVLVMIAMVVGSGPASMTARPTRLPALATGGGAPGGALLAPRAGATAVTAAKAGATPGASARPAKPRARATRRATTRGRYIAVGSARLDRRVRSGGIPSPAAAANLAVAGGGRVAAGSTGAIQLKGIPSAAASERLGPATLPYRPSDGVTLPRMAGERDSHAVDSHYGADTLPMDAPVELPALTPGAAAAAAQHRIARNELSHGSSPPPAVNGGLVTAF